MATRSAVLPRANDRRPGYAVINTEPPASHSHAAPTYQDRYRESSRTPSAPGPGYVTYNSIGIPTFHPFERPAERLVAIRSLSGTEGNNSRKDNEDRDRMGLPQQFQRSFKSQWARVPRLGLLGFGCMNLAIWEQLILLLPLALPHGGIGTILVAFVVISVLYGCINTSLAGMAREYPTYAGPFYWTAAYQTSWTNSGARHLLSWYCAWMSFLGMSINLVVNMYFISDVAIFLFTLAKTESRFLYSDKEPEHHLRVSWALPVTIVIATAVAYIPNWINVKHLPRLHTCFAVFHWLGFLIFIIAIPILFNKTSGLSMTV
ncbi:hypothetical protein C7974DRAFT_410822 [Boeremia exigua]|uniref:uncharacterized protein n=1 Tax=Boeremia exigua TaxID=749465 RepID=UPI001E8E720C|nr:uncharacterized protein C7974DRAFT_410822 [Boeremia exigua]KAH6639873.1 hypothetical protein C7974DRAFT_410822 [Boeremia exigua]